MYNCRVVNIPSRICKAVYGSGIPIHRDGMGLPYGNYIPQPDGIFSTACLSTGSFRNGYIGVFRFDGRCFCRTADGRIQLIHIDGICPGRTGCHVGNFLVVGIEAAVIDICLSAYMDAVIVDDDFIRSRACCHFFKFRLFTHH